MNKKDIKAINPQELGWLEYKLNSQEMDYVWRCIKNKGENFNKGLVGHVSNSYKLIDRGQWFFINTIKPLITNYVDHFDSTLADNIPTKQRHPYFMENWWVNYQKQHEFNPIHNHSGVYSFVIWMQIPFSWEQQNKKDIARKSNGPRISSFQFTYSSMLGDMRTYPYNISTPDEGLMLFFPSKLDHQVYPFYDCDEDRISVSGNVLINTTTVV